MEFSVLGGEPVKVHLFDVHGQLVKSDILNRNYKRGVHLETHFQFLSPLCFIGLQQCFLPLVLQNVPHHRRPRRTNEIVVAFTLRLEVPRGQSEYRRGRRSRSWRRRQKGRPGSKRRAARPVTNAFRPTARSLPMTTTCRPISPTRTPVRIGRSSRPRRVARSASSTRGFRAIRTNRTLRICWNARQRSTDPC